MISPFLACAFAVFYATGGAMVVAGKAVQTVAVPMRKQQPFRCLFKLYVACGAYFGAFAAFYTGVGIADERLVGCHVTHEERIDDLALQSAE